MRTYRQVRDCQRHELLPQEINGKPAFPRPSRPHRALKAAELLATRAERAPDRARFNELLARAPDVEPDEDDRL